MRNRSLRKVPTADVELFKVMRRQGYSLHEIAKHTGYPDSTVSSNLSRAGIRATVKLPGAYKFNQVYQTPAYRENNDEKHLALIAQVRPRGFPVAFLPARFRMRAA